MVRNNKLETRVKCKEISFGSFCFNNIDITESYINGILDYIIVPIFWEEQGFNGNEWDFISVEYDDNEKRSNISSYLADIAFVEITEKHTLKFNIESSGFHPKKGNNFYLA